MIFEKDKEVFDLLDKKNNEQDITVVFYDDKMIVGFKERGRRFGKPYYDKNIKTDNGSKTEWIILLLNDNGDIEEKTVLDDDITAYGDFRTFRVEKIIEKNLLNDHGELSLNNEFAGLDNRDPGAVISDRLYNVVPRYTYFIKYNGLSIGLPDNIVNWRKGVAYSINTDDDNATLSGNAIINKDISGVKSNKTLKSDKIKVVNDENDISDVNTSSPAILEELLDNKDVAENAGELIITKDKKPKRANKNNK